MEFLDVYCRHQIKRMVPDGNLSCFCSADFRRSVDLLLVVHQEEMPTWADKFSHRVQNHDFSSLLGWYTPRTFAPSVIRTRTISMYVQRTYFSCIRKSNTERSSSSVRLMDILLNVFAPMVVFSFLRAVSRVDSYTDVVKGDFQSTTLSRLAAALCGPVRWRLAGLTDSLLG